jgi:class 3 adenylate cyclase
MPVAGRPTAPNSRNASWLPTRRPGFPVFLVLIVAMLGIAIVCLTHSLRLVDKPFAGFLFYQYPSIGSFGDFEWPGFRAGARYRDVIEDVNGRRLQSSRELQQIVANTPVGTNISYRLNRHGVPVLMSAPVSVFTKTDFVKLFGLPFLGGIIFGVIGMIVYFLKPDTSAAWAFLMFCFFLGTYMLTGLASHSPPHSSWLNAVNILGMAFFPAACLHLSLLFPERSRLVERWRFAQFVPYIVSAALTLYLLRDITVMTSGTLPRDAFLRTHTHMLRGLYFARAYAILAALGIVTASGYVYWRSRSVVAKQRSRVILVGSALAFVPPTIAMPLTALIKIVVPFNLLAVPAVVFPASVGYAIARHNLFDVDIYIKRAVGYGLMTAAVAVGYLSTQTVVRTAILDPIFGDQAEHAYPILFAILVVFLFNPLNRRVQASVDRIFFRRKFDYKETVSAVSGALTSLLNLGQIITQMLRTVKEEMFVDAAGIILRDGQKGTMQAFFIDDGSDDVKSADVLYDDPLVELVSREKILITRYDMEENPRYDSMKHGCLNSFSQMAASMVIPLVNQGEVKGILALGEKKSGQFYGRDDIDLLNTMANQAAVAIQNAAAHEQVVHYAEQLAASLRRIQILESIKSNLAKFVPKTVQDLIELSPEAPSFDKREADVSVLFADITGYTRLSAQMELDQVNQLVERYFGAFLDEILKHGGDVNETAGDGLMVIFQDADSSRHARAAVLAAIGIQRRTQEINNELRGRSEPIAMHVGVNSGTAAVGATKIEGVAGTRWTYTASGPTTNLAARLAALGEGAAVIISDETRRRLGGEFDTEDLGLQSLKNVERPMRVYRLKGYLDPDNE